LTIRGQGAATRLAEPRGLIFVTRSYFRPIADRAKHNPGEFKTVQEER